MSFNLAWWLSAFVLIVAYVWFGRASRKKVTGVLIDSRDRYSLNHFQITLWTFLILSTVLAAFISSGFDVAALEIPETLVVVMGISLGSVVASGAVKRSKDVGGAHIARGNTKPSQIFLEEEGKEADRVVNITKFQNLVFTLVAAFAYLVLTFKTQDYPNLPEQVLW